MMTGLRWIAGALWIVMAATATAAARDSGEMGPSPRPHALLVPIARVSSPAATPKASNWAARRCGNVVFPTPGVANWQWTPALDGPGHEYGNDGWVVSGTAVQPSMSDADDPLVHPFGNDFEWYVAVDPRDEYLLAPGNASDNQDFGRMTRYARSSLRLDVPHGVLGIEIDGGLLPPAYRVREKDRVVIAGRWIVDCGHDDFHAEIHPPLLVAAARPAPGGGVIMTIASRPWLVGQTYREGTFADHVRHEVMRLLDIPLTAYCCSSQIEVHAPIQPPFAPSGDYDYWLAIPDSATASARIRYHFAVRNGVRVQLYRPNPNFVGLHVTLDAARFTAAPLPARHSRTNTPAELEKLDEGGRVRRGFDEALRRLKFFPWAKAALARGVKSDWYDPVDAPFSPGDPAGGILPLRALRVGRRIGMPVDWTREDQPFPVIGWVAIGAPARRLDSVAHPQRQVKATRLCIMRE